MTKCPCKDCTTERHIGCHAECDKYKAWKTEHDAETAEQRKQIEANNSYYEYVRESAKRIKRYCKTKK